MKHWNNNGIIMLCLVGALVISLNPLGANAAEFFVATTGNDSNSGTIGSPFLTLEKAASVMAPGDRMLIREGTYQRTAWSLNVPSGGGSWETATTIQNYQSEQVIITPQNPVDNGTDVIRLPTGKSWIIFNGLILDGLRNGLNLGGRMGFRFDNSVSNPNPSHHIRLINMEIRYTGDSNILTNDATNNEFINLHLHHAHDNDPSSTRNGPYGIYMSSANNLVKGCNIHDHRGFGIANYSGFTFQPNNNIYSGNIFHHNGRSGIQIAHSNGVQFINNIAYSNGTGGGVGYSGSSRVGIEFYGTVVNSLVYNNTTYNNSEGELRIATNASSSLTAKNNIFYGTKGSVPTVQIFAGSSGITLTNNTIYHVNAGLYELNQGSGSISNNIYKNPLFVNASNQDFHLKPGSPAIGNGIVLKEVTTDFDNIQRKEPIDHGAFIFVGASSLPDPTRPAPPTHVQIY